MDFHICQTSTASPAEPGVSYGALAAIRFQGTTAASSASPGVLVQPWKDAAVPDGECSAPSGGDFL